MSDRLSAYAPQALGLLRLVVGLLFIHSGMVLLFNIPASTYPPPPPEIATLMLLAGVLELVGGVMILVGLLTRPTAFILSEMMAVAYWGFHAPTSFFPSNNMGAAAILFCFVFFYLVFAGPGAWAVDNAAPSRRAGTLQPSQESERCEKSSCTCIVSLDGFIEGPNRELDWHYFVDDEFEEYINGVLASIDAMIFGRKAFELLADYWPTAAENPAGAADPTNPARHIEAARMMNEKQKIVFSKTLKKTEWNNSRIVGDDLAGEIARLTKEPGKHIALFAGAGIANAFMRLGLIDEYRLIVSPVLLGAGTPLFQGGYDRSILNLMEARTFKSGAMLLSYRPRE